MQENARSPLTQLSPLKPLSETLLFATNFLRHPNMLGSIIPSSRFLVDQVLEPIDWRRVHVIVEYGPGIGTFTGEILRRMRSDAQLVTIETNRAFVRFLQRALPDPRLHVVHDSAAEVQRVLMRLALAAPRYIISGIPLGSMPDPVRTELVKAFLVLKQGHAPSDALAREIQDFVKVRLAAHEYPRLVEFIDARAPLTQSLDDDCELPRVVARYESIRGPAFLK